MRGDPSSFNRHLSSSSVNACVPNLAYRSKYAVWHKLRTAFITPTRPFVALGQHAAVEAVFRRVFIRNVCFDFTYVEVVSQHLDATVGFGGFEAKSLHEEPTVFDV